MSSASLVAHDRLFHVALLGCGRVAENHLQAFAGGSLPTKLVAVCDIDGAKAEAKAKKYGTAWYTDLDAMLRAHPELDLVSVATPSGWHADNVVALARYGKPIVVEKPMALSVADCTRMMKACEKSGSRLFVIKQNRFNPGVVAARKALEEGRFGKLVMGTVRVRWRRNAEYYTDGWHGTWHLDGGVMAQQASHHADLLQWFFGEIETVQCQATARLLPLQAEDTAAAIYKFKSGALGIFEATVAARPETLEGSLSILGEKGSVVLGGSAVNKVVYWKFEDQRPEDAAMVAEASQDVPNVYGHGHVPYFANVLEAIVTGRPGLVEASEGRKNIAILSALYESAARGGVPLKPGTRQIRSPWGKRPAQLA